MPSLLLIWDKSLIPYFLGPWPLVTDVPVAVNFLSPDIQAALILLDDDDCVWSFGVRDVFVEELELELGESVL